MHSTPTRKLFLYIAMSLDGFIAGPNDELDFLSQVEMEGEDYDYSKFCQQIDTVIIGKRSFDKVAALGFEYPHLDKPVYIFTRQNIPANGNCITICTVE
jgi:dihydrofolate reductase